MSVKWIKKAQMIVFYSQPNPAAILAIVLLFAKLLDATMLVRQRMLTRLFISLQFTKLLCTMLVCQTKKDKESSHDCLLVFYLQSCYVQC